MLKFAYSTSVFRLRSLEDAIEGIERAGFTGVELIADRPHVFPDDMSAARVTELIRFLAQKKLQISNLNSALVTTAYGEQKSPSWIAEDADEREKRIRYTLSCLRMAAAMGIPHVSTDTGPGIISESLSLFEALDLYVGQMSRILPVAKKLSVHLLLQPEPDSLVQGTEDVLDMMRRLRNHEYVGINFDAGHFYCVGEDPCDAYEALRKYVYHVSLADMPLNQSHRHIQLGDGGMDISRFLNCLMASNYLGYVTIKLDSHDQRADKVAMASAQYLRERDFMPSVRE